jgi:glycerophosphoryl diester phosphodiesterase
MNFIDEAFIKRIKEEGYEYHIWTIDDAETARRFITCEVNSITTNRPGYLRKALAE